jgi:hypothetical protein
LDENNNQKTNKKGKKNRRKRKKQTPKYCEDSSSEDSDNFLYGAGESCRFQITEPVRKIALMENVSPDKLQDCEVIIELGLSFYLN